MPDSPLHAIAYILSRAFHGYSMIVLVAVVMSWIRINPSNPIVRIVNQLTEPPMRFIRKALPFVVMGGLDLSPIVLLIGVQLVANGLQRLAFSPV